MNIISTNPFDYAETTVTEKVLISINHPHGGLSAVDLPGRHGNIEIYVGEIKFGELDGSRLENMYVNAKGADYTGVMQAISEWPSILRNREPYEFIGCAYIGYGFAQLDEFSIETYSPKGNNRFLSLKQEYVHFGRSSWFRIDDEPMWHTHRLVSLEREVVKRELLKLLPAIGVTYAEPIAEDIVTKIFAAVEARDAKTNG